MIIVYVCDDTKYIYIKINSEHDTKVDRTKEEEGFGQCRFEKTSNWYFLKRKFKK